jgi:hypothetical protein
VSASDAGRSISGARLRTERTGGTMGAENSIRPLSTRLLFKGESVPVNRVLDFIHHQQMDSDMVDRLIADLRAS